MQQIPINRNVISTFSCCVNTFIQNLVNRKDVCDCESICLRIFSSADRFGFPLGWAQKRLSHRWCWQVYWIWRVAQQHCLPSPPPHQSHCALCQSAVHSSEQLCSLVCPLFILIKNTRRSLTCLDHVEYLQKK